MHQATTRCSQDGTQPAKGLLFGGILHPGFDVNLHRRLVDTPHPGSVAAPHPGTQRLNSSRRPSPRPQRQVVGQVSERDRTSYVEWQSCSSCRIQERASWTSVSTPQPTTMRTFKTLKPPAAAFAGGMNLNAEHIIRYCCP